MDSGLLVMVGTTCADDTVVLDCRVEPGPSSELGTELDPGADDDVEARSELELVCCACVDDWGTSGIGFDVDLRGASAVVTGDCVDTGEVLGALVEVDFCTLSVEDV